MNTASTAAGSKTSSRSSRRARRAARQAAWRAPRRRRRRDAKSTLRMGGKVFRVHAADEPGADQCEALHVRPPPPIVRSGHDPVRRRRRARPRRPRRTARRSGRRCRSGWTGHGRVWCAVAPGTQLLGEVGVEVRERLEEALRMAQPWPGEARRRRRTACSCRARESLCRRRRSRTVQMVRVLVPPFEAGEVAEDADAKPVLVTRRGHAGPQCGRGAVGQGQPDRGVVEYAPPGTSVLRSADTRDASRPVM